MTYVKDIGYRFDKQARAYKQPTLPQSLARWQAIKSRCPFDLDDIDGPLDLTRDEWIEWGVALLEDVPSVPSNLEMKAMSIVLTVHNLEQDFCRRFEEYLDVKIQERKEADDQRVRNEVSGRGVNAATEQR
jgi:hypothetical protein